ncbi:MAG: hemerythrin domain-containing protein [Bacteroidota bacterium]
MNEITEFMGNDHTRLDEMFKQFRALKNQDLNRARDVFSRFKSGLEKHIVMEESILFPIFELRTGMHSSGPTFVMRMEHREIKDYLQKIQTSISADDTNTDDLERDLAQVLTSHDDKEENILYPWIDISINAEEKRLLLERMKA